MLRCRKQLVQYFTIETHIFSASNWNGIYQRPKVYALFYCKLYFIYFPFANKKCAAKNVVNMVQVVCKVHIGRYHSF